MVLVVLAIIWLAVLVPPALRARAEGRPGDSIHAFHRQLNVLHRARPYGRGVAERARPSTHGSRTPAYGARPATPVASLAARRAMAAGRTSRPAASHTRAFAAVGVPSARSRTLRRRRDVFVTLLAAAVGTLALGLLPALRMMLLAHLVVDVLLAAYVVLLIRQRSLAAERELKVRFLPETRLAEPVLLRRSVN